MKTTKRILMAGLIAAALLAAPAGLSIATGAGGPMLGPAPTTSTAYAKPRRIPVQTATVEYGTDPYCDVWGNLINGELAKADAATTAKGRAYWLNEAKKDQDAALNDGCLVINPV
jgi:hypothetical protein